MDGGDQAPSQYGTSFRSSESGQPRDDNGRHVMGPHSQDRYSRSVASHSEMATQASSRPYLPEYQYSYQQQYQPQVQYSSSYLQDAPRSHQSQAPTSQQSYGTYGHGSSLPPVQQPSPYVSTSDYHQQQRQNAAIEVMAGQFGSGSINPYIQHDEQSVSVNMSQPGAAYTTSQREQSNYGSMSYGRPQLQPPFAPAADYSIMDQNQLLQTSYHESTSFQATEEGRRQYEQRLRRVNDAIIAGRVNEAGEQLLMATKWLVGSVKLLGLQHDDEDVYEQRVALWRQLNHSWEALGMKQKRITEDTHRTQQEPTHILSANDIVQLVDSLVLQCNQLEQHGLVDYEMGVWEEQIIDIFLKCLDLLPPPDI